MLIVRMLHLGSLSSSCARSGQSESDAPVTGCWSVKQQPRTHQAAAGAAVATMALVQRSGVGRAAVYTAHQVPAVAQERLEPVCEDVHDQLEGEQAGEEIVRGADEGVIWTVSVDLDVDDIDHEVLPSRSGIFVKRGKENSCEQTNGFSCHRGHLPTNRLCNSFIM